MNGLMLLLETVIYIPSDLVNCAKAGADAKAFAEWADIFLHPVSLVDTVQYNVKHHFAAITLEIAKAPYANSTTLKITLEEPRVLSTSKAYNTVTSG